MAIKKDKEKSVSKMSEEEKKAKKKLRLEANKNRPAGQRPNSKQVDIIDSGDGGKVITYAYPIRKSGSLVTSVAYNAKGEILSANSTYIPGVRAKSKKEHGTLVPGVAGDGKRKKGEEEVDEEEAPSEAPVAKDKKEDKKAKGKKKED